jgi:formamidopyrimidine-DNA glycosylase
MPELPEVERFRRYFEESAINKKIVETDLSAPKMLKGSSPDELKKFTEGYKFTSALSHGKYFFAGLSSRKYLMLHFGMTGYLHYYKLPEDASRHIRLQFRFLDGFYVAYDNQRKFGQIMLIDNIEEFITSRDLGPDPIKDNITYKKFIEIAGNRPGTVKSILMDQSLLSGIGNLYSDEIAFQANVHPSASFKSLTDEKKKEIYRKMISVLKTVVKKDGQWELLPEYLLNHRDDEDKCPLCGGEITHKTIAGRTSYFCKSHQKI